MRIRTIKPEFWSNEKLSDVSEPSHMFAAALLNYCDDEGYFNANPKLIKAALYPIREPSVNIHGMLTELSNIGYLRIGNGDDGRSYGHIVQFSEHQRINRASPSKIKGLATFTEHSVSVQCAITDDSALEQGTGNREQGKEQGTGPVKKPAKIYPDEFSEFWKAYPNKKKKQTALAAWKKMKPDITVCLSAISEQKKSHDWTKEGGKYIPHPSSWLNGGCWDDEVKKDIGPAEPKDGMTDETRAFLAKVAEERSAKK